MGWFNQVRKLAELSYIFYRFIFP
ncbi:hypothetical protein VIBNISOn1_1720080 [Vibrio nigripulchritudo SOn1]|uniref:Transposase n=1 Tax=Vibrio nigripulchritudo SOn1 TaxID=1238450 RepID=A0AAV2VP04_9VIBR|nr:hypothetical protein VIBNISOn1_1720080 [Vibrio nigripulchritudo SOn1]